MTDISTTQTPVSVPAAGSPAVPAAAPPTAASAAAAAPAVLHYSEAYDKALPASKALTATELIAVNIDVPTAVTTAAGALPQILALRDQVVKDLPNFDIQNFDQLETYAFATGHAHAVYSGSSAPPEALLALNEQGLALRDTLYSDAIALSNRGIIGADKLGDFKANVGYQNLAFDLLGLASVLRLNWDKIVSKTAVQLAELDQAESIGEQLVNAVGAREQAPAIAAAQAQQRQRNFTLFARAYDQARRAITFLHWDQDDIDSIAPSLYSGRNTGHKKPDAPQPVATAPAAGTPVAAASTTTAPTKTPSPEATTPAANAPAGTTHAPTTSAAAGLPGASPFVEAN